MNKRTFSITRRDVLTMGGAVAGAALFPTFSNAKQPESKNVPMSSTALFYKPSTTILWDVWVYHHNGKFYLYYVTGGMMEWNGVGLAISDDGVHWEERGQIIQMPETGVDRTGAGMVWAIRDKAGKEKFMMSHSEWQITDDPQYHDGLRQTMLFFESDNLTHWKRLPQETEFHHDAQWYNTSSRWDNIWVVPKPEGGFYGYWLGVPKDGKPGFGFGESKDSITWKALESPDLHGVPWTSEITAVHVWQNKYYIMYKSWEHPFHEPMRWGINTLVGDSPSGPFSPTPKNHRLLVGNASYFSRFVGTPDGVLVCHHSWETDETQVQRVGSTFSAPMKLAEWDEEGTLRMKWWEGNDKVKTKPVNLKSKLVETAFDPKETLILEGVMPLTAAALTGIYLQGFGKRGTGFIIFNHGVVEFGDMYSDITGFDMKGYVDRELSFGDKVHFRLVRKGQLTEFYLNDYLMQCYSLPEQGTGRIGLIGPETDFSELKAWYCA